MKAMTFRKTFRYILTAVIIISIFVPFNTYILGNTDSFAYAESDDLRYGRTQLENKAQRYIYDKYVTAIKGTKKTITLDNVKYDTTVENFEVARYAVWKDYPEYAYWKYFDDTFYTISGGEKKKVIKINLKYDSELKSRKNEYEARCKAIVKAIPKDCVTETQKAKYLNDVLGKITTYRDNSNGEDYLYEQQTSYGPILYGYGVCEGYAKAYSDLLRRAGIKSWPIYGYLQNDNAIINPKWNVIEYNGHIWIGHAWNMVWMDEKCLFCDPTTNDADEIDIGVPIDCEFGKCRYDCNQNYYFHDCTSDDEVVDKFQNKCIVNEAEESLCIADYIVDGSLDGTMLDSIIGCMSEPYKTVDATDGKEKYVRAVCLTSNDNSELTSWLKRMANSGKTIYDKAGMKGTCWYGAGEYGDYVWLYLMSTELSDDISVRKPDSPIVAIRKSESKGKIYLNWYAVDDDLKYEVYRSTSKNGKYKLIKTTSSLKYTDSNISKGKRYYYKVRAVDEEISSDFSILCNAKIG